MAEITTIAALYLSWESEKRRKPERRHVWVHDILRRRSQLGEFHHLLQELRLDDGRFQRYFRLTGAMFDDRLARVGSEDLPSGHQLQLLHITSGQAQR